MEGALPNLDISGANVVVSYAKWSSAMRSAAATQAGSVAAPSGALSGGRPAGGEVSDEVLAGQDGGADAAEKKDQDSDGVQVGLDQPERADDQPKQYDQGHRSDVPAAHMADAPLRERLPPRMRVYPKRDGGTP